MKEYTDYVVKLENGEIGTNASSAEAKDMAMDVVMLSLRTARGLDVKSFARSFGKSLALELCRTFVAYVKSGHVIAMDDERRRLPVSEFEAWLGGDGDETAKDGAAFIRLSDPDGFLLSNELIAIAFGVISP